MPQAHQNTSRGVLWLLLLVMSALAPLAGCATSGDPGKVPTATTASPSNGTATPEPGEQSTGDPSGSTDDPSGSTDDPSGSTDDPSGSTDDPSSPTTTQAPKRNVIEWILGLGVDAPSGPTGDPKEDAFKALSRRDCDRVNQEFQVLGAAAAACLAASGTGDVESQWSRAKQVRDSVDPQSLDCMDAAAYGVLDLLVDAHEAYPELPFQFTGENGPRKSTCLRVSSVKPAQGSSGDLVTIRGLNLDRATAVRLEDPNGAADVSATIVSKSRTQLKVRLPDGIQRSGYNLWIRWQQPTGETTAWVPFTYGPGSTTETEPPNDDGSESPLPEDSTSAHDGSSQEDQNDADQDQSGQEELDGVESPPAAPNLPSPTE